MWTRMSRKGGILVYFLFFTILTPPSLVLVKDKFIRIVVDADKAWLLRPENIYDTVSMGNIHHFIVELKPGKNEITVYYEKEGKTESKNLTIYSYPSENFKVKAKLYNFHKTEREEICKECHSIEFKSVSKKEDLDCFTCHKEKFKTGINYHPPFEELSCDNCHDKIFNRPKAPDICQTCHDVEIGFYLHSPYAKGECVICHDPHSSIEDKFLKNKVNALCYLCHEKNYYGKHHPVAMHPGEEKGITCNKCHSPHGTRYNFHLRWPNKPVCTVCHKK